MANQVTVTCPHCGSTSTYQVGVTTGSTGVQCKQCHKGFRIYLRNGQVEQVKLH